jgi:hypothetical protein
VRTKLSKKNLALIRSALYAKYSSIAEFCDESGLHRNTMGLILSGASCGINDRTRYLLETSLGITLG